MPHPTTDNKPPQGRRKTPAKDDAPADRHAADESRSFATDTPPGGHMGSGGDPSEGKRD